MALEILTAIEEKESARTEGRMASPAKSDLSMTRTSSHSYEKPSSTRICLFQIAESCDIVRVTYLLEFLNSKPRETLA